MIVKSTSPDVTIPEVSITEFVLRHAARLGDKPALIDGPSGRALTYRQLAEGVRKAAAGLTKLVEGPMVRHLAGSRRATSSPSTAPMCRSTR